MAASGFAKTKRKTICEKAYGSGLNPLAVGSRDAPKGTPDASGDHRTKTQRVFQVAQPPDAETSVRCLRTRQAEHQTHLTGRARDTVPASGECCLADSPHQTHCRGVRCIVWCSSDLFFKLKLNLTFTQPSSNFKKTQISTNWNWYE